MCRKIPFVIRTINAIVYLPGDFPNRWISEMQPVLDAILHPERMD